MVSDGVSVPRAEVPDQRPGQGAPKGIWRLIELEPPGSADFDNPAYEFRRLFSKWLGTFLLVVVGAGAGVVHGAISRTAAVTAPALTGA